MTATKLLSPSLLQYKKTKKKKATATTLPLLSSPSSLRCNKTKGRRQQQPCSRCLLCHAIKKQKHREGNISNAIIAPIAFFSTLQQNRKKKATIVNVVVTFFIVLQGKKKQ
jgi:alpha-D-ribose 1-methylphosphonate 5-triphosphate synthase subunit PhnG